MIYRQFVFEGLNSYPGTGKTHLAIGLGMKACACGFNVLYRTAASLSTELCEARDAYRLSKLEKALDRTDLLILDELSYLSFNRHQSELLFKVISERSERSSTIVTTNLSFSRWTEMFESETMVAALVDRLTFRSHLLDMNGDSYRLSSSLQAVQGGLNIHER
jgi:DNA replication protein DnaC